MNYLIYLFVIFSYKDIDTTTKSVINSNNLKRIISVNHIKKHKIDSNSDGLGIIDINKFKKNLRDSENITIKSLRKLGPPKFIKTRFKLSTIKEYNVYNGNYFGKVRKELQFK